MPLGAMEYEANEKKDKPSEVICFPSSLNRPRRLSIQRVKDRIKKQNRLSQILQAGSPSSPSPFDEVEEVQGLHGKFFKKRPYFSGEELKRNLSDETLKDKVDKELEKNFSSKEYEEKLSKEDFSEEEFINGLVKMLRKIYNSERRKAITDSLLHNPCLSDEMLKEQGFQPYQIKIGRNVW